MKNNIIEKRFNDWVKEGNVTKINGYFSTQDTLWRNQIKSKKQLFRYFITEFNPSQCNIRQIS